MKTNPSTLNQNLSIISDDPQTSQSTLKRFLLCTLAWAAVLVFSTAIAIAQPAPAGTVQRTDGLIEMDVVKALDNSNSLKSEQINAATIQGEVTLTGNVSSEASRELAEMITSRVSGVTHVQNNLTVANSNASTQTAPVTRTEIQPPANEVATVEQPQVATTNDPPPPHVQLPPTDTEDVNEGVATQTVTPNQQLQQQTAPIQPPPPPDQTPAQQNQAPVPQNQPQRPTYSAPPNQPGYSNNAQPQLRRPQPQPDPSYGAHAPAPPYDPTPLLIHAGTNLDLRTNEFLDTKHAKDGTTFDMTVIRDIYAQGRLAIPRGAVAHGVVVQSKSSGKLGGAPELSLKLVSIDLGPNTYPINSYQFKVRGPNKSGLTAGNIVGGTIFGALIGAAVGRGPGAAIGAIAGAGTGTALSAASPNPRAWIPAEALVTFHIQENLTVVPVTPQEAFRLAQDVMQGGPSLYSRRAVGYYGSNYPYPAPLPFYHPYYVMGGYYYWR